MKTKQKRTTKKKPLFSRYDPALDKYEGKVSKKTEELNEELKNNPVFRESLIEMMKKYS